MLRLFTSKKYKGFTLLELLVVIAIIGILVAIIAVSVMSARAQGRDTSIMSHLAQVKTEAEMMQVAESSYANLCDSGGLNTAILNLGELNTQVINQGGSIDCYAGSEEYCVQSELNVSGYYCLDHTGFSGKVMPANNCRAASINCQP